MADVVGSAAFELRADPRRLKKDMEAAQRELKSAVGRGVTIDVKLKPGSTDKVRDSLRGVRQEALGAGRGVADAGGVMSGSLMGAAAAAAGVAAALAAIRFAAGEALAAMKFADEIADTANKLQVSTDALQEWRYALRVAGGDAQSADDALMGFTTSLGSYTAGLRSAGATQAFKALGLTKEDLKQFDNAEDALAEVTKRIADLGDASQQAAIAEKLGISGLLPLLREGSTRMEDLRDEAHRLGIVMDAELVKKGADAQDQFETLADVIDVQLKSAFVDLGPTLVDLMDLLAQLATMLSDVFDGFRSLEAKTMRGLMNRRDDLIAQSVQYMPNAMKGSAIAQADLDRVSNELAQVEVMIQARAQQRDEPRLPKRTGATTRPIGNDGGDSKPKGPSAADLAARREELRLEAEAAAARASGNADVIRAMERRLELFALTKAYEDAGLKGQAAELAALKDLALVDAARAKAQEQAISDHAIDVQLTAAQAEGLYDVVEQLERGAEKAKLIAFYQAQGRDIMTAQIMAGMDQNKIAEALLRTKERTLAVAQAEHDLELARIRGDSEREIRKAERPVELERRTEDIAAREGIALPDARKKAEVELDQEDEARLQGQFRDVIKGGFRAAMDGDLEGFAREWVANWASKGLEDALNSLADVLLKLFKDAFGQAGQGAGGAGGGGWLDAIGSVFGFGGGEQAPAFGGARAYGGPVTGGVAYRVGEFGPETLVMPGNGSIIPNGAMARAPAGASGGGRGMVTVRVQSDDPKFRAFIADVAGPIAATGDSQVVGASMADRQRAAVKQQYRARR